MTIVTIMHVHGVFSDRLCLQCFRVGFSNKEVQAGVPIGSLDLFVHELASSSVVC